MDFVRRVKSGDAEAWREIFFRYFRACVRFVAEITGDDAAAKDIVQDGFMKLWSAKGRIGDDSNLESLIYVIMKNGALNLLRSRRKIDGEDIFARLTDGDSAADEKMVEKEKRAMLREAVASLPEQRKAVIEKKLGGGRTRKFPKSSISPKKLSKTTSLWRAAI